MSTALQGMNITEYVEKDNSEYLILNYKVKDVFQKEDYEKMFFNLKTEGIISKGQFEDMEWVLKRKDGHKAYIKFDLGIRPKLNENLKHYVLVKLEIQKVAVSTVSGSLNRIKAELFETHYLDADYINTYREQFGICTKNRQHYLKAFKEFLMFAQVDNASEYFQILDSVPFNYAKKSRDLPCYESIILFDYIINDFIERKNILQKARYYPVLIWWKISSVIPLRPGEVYQLPKNCVFEKNGKCYIHIERIKSQYERKKYSEPIIKDFEIKTDIYKIIKDYISYISEFDESEYLFSVESLAKVAGVKPRDKDIKRLTNYSMQTIYNHFKREVIEQEYHYNLVPLGKKQDKNDIEVIKMGDVRHLAIINLMMMGYNPLYIKELAGHRDLDTQMGYYNHIDTLASAKSHVLKDMIKRFNTELELNTYQSGEYVVQKKILGAAYYDLPLVFDGKGRCKSTDFPNSCVTLECIFCPHFIPDKNLSKDYYNALHEKNRKDLEALKMELKLLVLGSIDNRTFEKLGKKIGITLNKEIMIEAYTHLQEETE